MIDKEILLKQIHLRLIDEGVFRIRKCLTMVTDQQIWYSHNKNTNSIGSLILHLNGNVRQWLIKGIGGMPYKRYRDSEFDRENLKSREDLMEILSDLEADIAKISLDKIVLKEQVTIQGIKEPFLGVIIHVIEHFSYHVGQITLLTKLIADVDTEYYNSTNLNDN